MRGALGKVDGISQIDIKAGDMDFTVHYDPAKVKLADMVAKLVAAGEAGAKVKS